MSNSILIVGAGFAGAVHARELAENGWHVILIDRRGHIAGNAYDRVDENGIRHHVYGPHLFHTASADVVSWLSRFTEWLPYRHRVRVKIAEDRYVPFPINLETLNSVFGISLNDAHEAEQFLARQAEPCDQPRNAAEYLHARIGRTMTDLFFRPYTKKMWDLELEELDAGIIKRIPLRFNHEEGYFPADQFQALPKEGYTRLFENMLRHPNIQLRLNTDYEPGMEKDFRYCFNSMAIDEFFAYCAGPLPYRSIRFHRKRLVHDDGRHWSVTNYSDDSPYTRETWWHCLPGHLIDERGPKTITVEEPCDYRDNGHERYYPVRTADKRYQKTYDEYRRLAASLPNMEFIGRCGTYQYLDMDQVVAQSLTNARRWLASTC